MKKVFLFMVLAMIAALQLGLSSGSYAADGNKIVIDGSTTVGPIAKAFAEYYMKQNPGVNITVSESGSGNGAKSLVNNTCSIATLSRFMKDTEFKAAVDNGVMPVAHVVAMDGIAMIVHPSNPVKNLTTAQIKDIYMGKIKNWKDVGGPNKNIIIVSRDTNSGTYETFETLIMKSEKIVSSAEYVGSNGAVRQRVQSTDAAIGYVGLGFIDKSVKDVTVNNIKADLGTVASGKYPIARPLYMFTNGYPELGSHVFAFVTLHLSEQGQEIIEAIGYVPVTNY